MEDIASEDDDPGSLGAEWQQKAKPISQKKKSVAYEEMPIAWWLVPYYFNRMFGY